MQFNEIRAIPKPVRITLLGLLFAGVIASLGLGLWFTFVRPDRELAILAYGATQSAFTGFVVVSLVMFSFRMKDTRDIQAIIEDFFIDDVLTALKGVEIEAPEFVTFETSSKFRKNLPQVKLLSKVSTDFCRGRDAAGFLLERRDGPPFDIYLKVNVRHITIKYFFDPALFDPANEEAEFKRYFEQTLTGAESVGYTHKLVRRYHSSKKAQVLELSLYFKAEADMLANPAERLFLSSDLRTMTSSMLHTLRGVEAIRNSKC